MSGKPRSRGLFSPEDCPSRRPDGSRPAAAAPGDPGTATFAIVAPGGSTPLGNTVDVAVNLSQFTPSVPQPKWGGYDLNIKYDCNTITPGASVAEATADTSGASNPCGNFWANNEIKPQVVSGCAFQSSTLEGITLETITFTCLNNGVANIHIAPRGEPGVDGTGSGLFDQNANDFAMTLVDGQITCGSPATPTNTNTPTATNTAVATSTGTATATPGRHSSACRSARRSGW